MPHLIERAKTLILTGHPMPVVIGELRVTWLDERGLADRGTVARQADHVARYAYRRAAEDLQ